MRGNTFAFAVAVDSARAFASPKFDRRARYLGIVGKGLHDSMIDARPCRKARVSHLPTIRTRPPPTPFTPVLGFLSHTPTRKVPLRFHLTYPNRRSGPLSPRRVCVMGGACGRTGPSFVRPPTFSPCIFLSVFLFAGYRDYLEMTNGVLLSLYKADRSLYSKTASPPPQCMNALKAILGDHRH